MATGFYNSTIKNSLNEADIKESKEQLVTKINTLEDKITILDNKLEAKQLVINELRQVIKDIVT